MHDTLAQGFTSIVTLGKAVAGELDGRVKTDLARAFDKLGLTDRTSAVRRAIEFGLIR